MTKHPVVLMCEECGQQMRRQGKWRYQGDSAWAMLMRCPECNARYVVTMIRVDRKEVK